MGISRELSVQRFVRIAGVAFALLFATLPGHRPLSILWAAVSDRFPDGGTTVLSMVLILTVVGVLSLLSFTVLERTPGSYGIRGIGWKDVGAMFAAWYLAYGLLSVAHLLVAHFSAPHTGPESTEDVETYSPPLAIGLASSIVAGFAEEFIFRGFLIAELGELLRNRWAAAVISILAFTWVHSYNAYGWSIDLLYPGLAGVVLTGLFFWRSNLLICMLMHAGVDVVSTLVTWYQAR